MKLQWVPGEYNRYFCTFVHGGTTYVFGIAPYGSGMSGFGNHRGKCDWGGFIESPEKEDRKKDMRFGFRHCTRQEACEKMNKFIKIFFCKSFSKKSEDSSRARLEAVLMLQVTLGHRKQTIDDVERVIYTGKFGELDVLIEEQETGFWWGLQYLGAKQKLDAGQGSGVSLEKAILFIEALVKQKVVIEW